MPKRTIVRQLLVKLEPSTIATRAASLASTIRERASVESAAKAAQSAAREKIKGLDASIEALSETVATGQEIADVECAELAQSGEVLTVRLDTRAVVDRRAMTASELDAWRQGTLDYYGGDTPPARDEVIS